MRSDGSSTSRQVDGVEMVDNDERLVASNTNESATRTAICCHGNGGNARSIRSRRRQMSLVYMHSMTLFILLQLLIAMIAGQITTTTPTVTDDETTTTTECVCSPRQYYFKLNLSASCPPLPPPFPPNDVFGAGVKDYTCSIGPEPVQNEAGDLLVDGEELEEPTGDESNATNSNDSTELTRARRRYMQQSSGVGTSTASDYFPEVDVEWNSANFTTSALTTEVDVTPVVIYSIQFLEVDTSFNVINQDSAYVRGIDFVSGDVFSYTSISATSRGAVPGGMNMVLRGVNAEGDPVRNVFTITYTNECGVPTFEEGDAIGWVVFDNFEPASEDTCGTLTNTPSTGVNEKETSPPSSVGAKETSPPSKSPTSDMSSSKMPTIASMSYDYIYGSGGSKSSKVSKSSKTKGGKSNYKSTQGSDGGWQNSPSTYGKHSTRPEPYRALLRETLLNEIKLDQYDHYHQLAELRNTKRKQRR